MTKKQIKFNNNPVRTVQPISTKFRWQSTRKRKSLLSDTSDPDSFIPIQAYRSSELSICLREQQPSTNGSYSTEM